MFLRLIDVLLSRIRFVGLLISLQNQLYVVWWKNWSKSSLFQVVGLPVSFVCTYMYTTHMPITHVVLFAASAVKLNHFSDLVLYTVYDFTLTRNYYSDEFFYCYFVLLSSSQPCDVVNVGVLIIVVIYEANVCFYEGTRMKYGSSSQRNEYWCSMTICCLLSS